MSAGVNASVNVTCPTCGTVSVFDDVRRDALSFCRVCDYPLFWVRSTATGAGENDLEDDQGLRRLPGTAGRVVVATLSCWFCDEPNPVTGVYCLRCGSDLHPKPPPPPPPPEWHTVPVPVFVEPVAPAPPRIPSLLWAWVPAIIGLVGVLAGLIAWLVVWLT